MSYKLTCLLALSLLASSCSNTTENHSQVQNSTAISSHVNYKIIAADTLKGFHISDIEIDTTKALQETKGITISFDVATRPELFQELNKENYTSVFVDVKCTTPEGKEILHRNELFKSPEKKKFVHINRDCFISQPTVRHVEIGFPFRVLEMPGGPKELLISIEAYPAKFAEDSSSLSVRMLKGIAKTNIGGTKLSVLVHAPELYKASFTVLKAKINTQLKKAEKYDVALTGTGYPDLFWEIFCGNDYIYNSPVEKNKETYNKKYSSPTIYCSKNDVINLGLVDYDNGPFNTQDDVIGIYKIKASDLTKEKTDTLKFGKVEYMIVQSKLEKAF